MNTLKTTFLMALLTVLLVTGGGALGGNGGMMTAFLFALMMNGVSYWFSDKIVLRMYNAQAIGALTSVPCREVWLASYFLSFQRQSIGVKSA